VTVESRGRSAAESLWAGGAAVDVEERLSALHATDRTRTRCRRAGVAASVLVAVVAVGSAVVRPALDRGADPVQPGPGPTLPDLGTGYDVLAADTAPSGRFEAVATLRAGLPAAVVVRRVGASDLEVVWAAGTAQELVRENPSRAVAVAWAPDGRRLAILVARPPYGGDGRTDELDLLTVDADGRNRRDVPADLGACTCATTLPALAWSAGGRLDVDVPQGTTTTHHRVTVP
jgi:hypothetical protein